jgi:hypothetical protein
VQNAFFYRQRILNCLGAHASVNAALKKIRRRVGGTAGEAERVLRPGINLRIEGLDGFKNDVGVDSKPVATVPVGADEVAAISLTDVVKRNHIGVGDEGRCVLVLDMHSGAREDEAAIRGRSGVVKTRVLRMAAKGADADRAVIEHDAIELARCVLRETHCDLQMLDVFATEMSAPH